LLDNSRFNAASEVLIPLQSEVLLNVSGVSPMFNDFQNFSSAIEFPSPDLSKAKAIATKSARITGLVLALAFTFGVAIAALVWQALTSAKAIETYKAVGCFLLGLAAMAFSGGAVLWFRWSPIAFALARQGHGLAVLQWDAGANLRGLTVAIGGELRRFG
jgi:hypothetical protein